MATINYWLCRQNFVRYDSLFWHNHDGKVTLHFKENEVVANVDWFVMIKDEEEYCIPMFEFVGAYEHWNGNQLRFFIGQVLELEINL